MDSDRLLRSVPDGLVNLSIGRRMKGKSKGGSGKLRTGLDGSLGEAEFPLRVGLGQRDL